MYLKHLWDVLYDGDLSHVMVNRQNGKKLSVNLLDFLLQHQVDQDILLEEGDQIHVPRLDHATGGDEEFLSLSAAGIYPQQFPIRVLGEVEKPGVFYVSTSTPYLNTALALASGYKMNALRKAVKITRRNRNNRMYTLIANPQKNDLVLRPNDVVEIRDKHSAKGVRGLETFSRILQPFIWGLSMKRS